MQNHVGLPQATSVHKTAVSDWGDANLHSQTDTGWCEEGRETLHRWLKKGLLKATSTTEKQTNLQPII